MQSPDACAAELVRAVKELRFVGALINGTTEGRFLDHPSYDGLLAAAVELDVPIYIHPHLPPEAVRQAYYSDLPPGAGRVLEAAGWGWHSETAIHVLRMVLAGTLDRHPRLKLIIGHMGEMLPMMLARIDEVFALDIEHLKRPISRAILDQVWLTTSGIFSEPPFLAALLTFGIDRIMFSVDYPYAPNAKGRDFLDGISLAPTQPRWCALSLGEGGHDLHPRRKCRLRPPWPGNSEVARVHRAYGHACHMAVTGAATGSDLSSGLPAAVSRPRWPSLCEQSDDGNRSAQAIAVSFRRVQR